jgi:protein-S-isoprenylcysteine O-methyltransferase Ste14
MINAAEPAEVPSEPEAKARSRAGLRHAAANIGVALMFFLALMPNAAHYGSGAANLIWLVGAALMGVLSLIRVPPSAAMVTPKALAAVTGMLLMPTLIKAHGPAMSTTVASAGMVLELAGVALSQVARVYMGRRFGLLPANRGIVSTGPFRFVRHPIYVGWFVLSLGFALSYPSVRNFAMIALTLPFMMWRITLEEELLTADVDYRVYCERVRYRLIPGLY